MPKHRQDPALGEKNTAFRLGLVPWLVGPGRNDCTSIMNAQIVIGGIDVRFIPAGFGDPTLQIVGNDNLGNPSKIFKSMDIKP